MSTSRRHYRSRALLIAILLAFVSASALAVPRRGPSLERKAELFKRDIRKALRAKKWRGVKLYYHADLDGVLTAKAMEHFLRAEGVKHVEFQHIQYGSREYAVSKPKAGYMPVLVDFAHGKPWMAIHTDHHQSQVGVGKDTAKAFVRSPSNGSFIAALAGVLNEHEVSVCDMVDGAQYAHRGYCAADTRQTILNLDRFKSERKKTEHLGHVVNAKLLAMRNKRAGKGAPKGSMLNEVLATMESPSLASLNKAIDGAVDRYRDNSRWSVRTPRELDQFKRSYVDALRSKVVKGGIDRVIQLRTGESMMLGNVIVQHGAPMPEVTLGGYNRYAPFEVHPKAQYQCISWNVGLVQVSKNPFKKGHNPYDLGKLMLGPKGVIGKWQRELKGVRISLARMKGVAEVEVSDAARKASRKGGKSELADAVGFTWEDFSTLYKQRQIKGIDLSDKKKVARIEKLMKKQFNKLTLSEMRELAAISVSGWDVIAANSGGHRDITNISGLNYLPKSFRGGYTTFMKEVQQEAARVMMDKKLEPARGRRSKAQATPPTAD